MVDDLGRQISSMIKGLLWVVVIAIIVIVVLGVLLGLTLAGIL